MWFNPALELLYNSKLIDWLIDWCAVKKLLTHWLTGVYLGFYQGGCPIHLKGAPNPNYFDPCYRNQTIFLDLEEIIVKTKTANINKRYYLAAHRRLVNVLTSNSAFFIFAVLVVWFSHSRPYKMFSTVKFFYNITT